MNSHPIEVHNIGGRYTAHFWTIWNTKQMNTVTNDDGEPVSFPTWHMAAVAAYQARDAAEEGRFTHWRGVPQIKPCPKVWEARSAAGRRMVAERELFKQEAAE